MEGKGGRENCGRAREGEGRGSDGGDGKAAGGGEVVEEEGCPQ